MRKVFLKLNYPVIVLALFWSQTYNVYADLLPSYIQEDLSGTSYYEDATTSFNYSELFDEETMLATADIGKDVFSYVPKSKSATLPSKEYRYNTSEQTANSKKSVKLKRIDMTAVHYRPSMLGFNFYGSWPILLAGVPSISKEYQSIPSNFGLGIYMEGSLSRFVTIKLEGGAEIYKRLVSGKSNVNDTMPVNAYISFMTKLYPILDNGFYLGAGISFNYHFESTSNPQTTVPALFFVPIASLGYRADFGWGSVDTSVNYRYYGKNSYPSIWFHENYPNPSKEITHALGIAISIGFAI